MHIGKFDENANVAEKNMRAEGEIARFSGTPFKKMAVITSFCFLGC